jgi:REP element-mobilizing transposase RayT
VLMPFRLFVLLTWTTRGRAEPIDDGVAEFLHRFLPPMAARFGAQVLEAATPKDHVHLVLALPPRLDVPRLVQGLKGASARIANRDRVSRTQLRWAHGYDLQSVSPNALPRVQAYLAQQDNRKARSELARASRPSGRTDAEPAL